MRARVRWTETITKEAEIEVPDGVEVETGDVDGFSEIDTILADVPDEAVGIYDVAERSIDEVEEVHSDA